MDERKRIMLDKIKVERHLAAVMTMENIKYIKEECKTVKHCYECKYYNKKDEYYNPCLFGMNTDHSPEDWDEYEITERMYK